MADDKRAEAMRKAIAESDAQKSVGSDKEKSGKKLPDLSAMAEKIPVAGLKEKALGFWKTKQGKIAVGAVAGVLVLLIAVSVISGLTGSVNSAPAAYELGNAILCVYESDEVNSGYAYDAYVEIVNTGDSNIYARDVSFMISDDDGNRIMIDNNISLFPAIIQPGEKGYMFNRFGTELTGVYDKEMNLRLVPTYTIAKSDATPPTYPVENVTVSQGDRGQKMSGQVTNNTSKTVSSIYVVGLTYNKDGYCTGISGTFVTNVEPHVSVNVQFDPMNMIRAWRTEQVTDYMIYAY